MSFCVGFCRVLFLCRLLPLPLHVRIWRDYYSIMCLKLHFFFKSDVLFFNIQLVMHICATTYVQKKEKVACKATNKKSAPQNEQKNLLTRE